MFNLNFAVGAVSKRNGAGWNQIFDVRIVQNLLNEKLASEKIKSNRFEIPLKVDGFFGSQTEAAIDYFQIEKVKLFHHDSVVFPAGPTFRKLIESVSEKRLTEIWNDAAAHVIAVNSGHAGRIARHANRSSERLRVSVGLVAVIKAPLDLNQLPKVEPISDVEFVDVKALNVAQIVEILKRKNSNLAQDDSVAKMFYETANKYGINPKALLATLAQEQNWGRNGKLDKAMGLDAGSGGQPLSLPFQNSVEGAASKYSQFFAEGKLKLNEMRINYDPSKHERKAALGRGFSKWQAGHPDENIILNNGFKYTPRSASEYAKLRYTPFTIFPPQKSRPYDDWVNLFRSF